MVMWGAPPEDWFLFSSLLGLAEDMLPVVSNPNANISEKSSLKALGKTPSRYDAKREVVGIAEWTKRKTTDKQIDIWSAEPDYGICLQARTVRAFDIDVADKAKAEQIKKSICFSVARTNWPARVRDNSGKILLPFKLKGDFAKRQLKVDGGVVEFLANGQQFVASGTHTSGARYEWLWGGGDSPNIPEITPEQLEKVWTALENEYGTAPTESFNANRHKGDYIACDDPRVAKLRAHPNFLYETPDRKLFLTCPFKDEHTGESGESETAYFPKGTNEYPEGHYVCQHAHCRGKADSAFDIALGFHDDDFTPFVCEDFETLSLASQAAESINQDEPDAGADKKEEKLFPCYTGGEFIKRPRPNWIVRDILPEADLAAIYGESGAGKTFVALDMALAIGRGVPWLGKDVKQGRVVYIAAEGAGGFRNRLEAYALHRKVSIDTIPIDIIPVAPNFLSNEEALRVAKTVIRGGSKGKAKVVFVDTLAQVTIGGDENSAEDVSKAIANCKNIGLATGATVVLVHHAGKDLERGLRGWSGLKGALDANLEILKGDGSARIMRVEKMKDGRDGEAWNFTLVSVPLPQSDPFEPEESSVVIEFMGPAAISTHTVEKKLTIHGIWNTHVKAVWERLSESSGEEYVSEAFLLAKAVEEAKTAIATCKVSRHRDNIARAILQMKNEGKLLADADGKITVSSRYR